MRDEAKTDLGSLDEKFSATCNQLDTVTSDHHSETAARFDNEHSHFEQACSDLQQLVRTTGTDLEVKLAALSDAHETQSAALQSSIGGSVR